MHTRAGSNGSSTRLRKWRTAAFLGLLAGFGPCVAWGADRGPAVARRPTPANVAAPREAIDNPSARSKPVSTEEKIRFEQDKAHAHMRELESRMFRVADLLRETQPDDSARLLTGVHKSRDQLIVEQMREASELIATLDLNKATTEEKEIIAKLEELKRLLLTNDLDLELKLEQLRKLREAQDALARLTEREKQQIAKTQPLDGKPAERKALEGLKDNEQRNQRSGQDVAQSMKRLGPQAAQAVGAMGGACQCMGGARNKLGASKPKDATGEQKKAVEKMQQAAVALKEAEAKLQKEIEALARQRVIENLTKMIAQQKQAREATERLVPRVAEKQRQAVLAVRQLAPLEEAIAGLCRASIELVELAHFSVVLPAALGAVESDMNAVAERLRDGRADDECVSAEKKIEADLLALLEALRDATGGDPKAGQCKGCKGDKNKLLSEVRILRLMEAALHRDTRTVDRGKRENLLDVAAATERTHGLERRQDDLRKVTARLHSMTCPHCLEEGDSP